MKRILSIILLISLTAVSVSLAQNAITGDIDAFVAKTGAKASIDKATGSLSFLKFPSARAMKVDGLVPREKALNFLSQNAKLFGIRSGKDTYQVAETKRDNYGLDHVVVQQYYQGVPVYDGVLKFHYNKSADLASMNGNYIQVPKLNATPSVSARNAEEAAIRHVFNQKKGEFSAPLRAVKSTLYIFQKGLAQGYQGVRHLAYEVEVSNNVNVREFVFVSAHSKEIIEQFTGIHSIHRTLYEVSTANQIWDEGDAFPGTLDIWQQSEVVSSGHMYNFMFNAFGFKSYDGADAPMLTINNNPDINCPNANWNGTTANYCTGTAADDVVAHEWGHAYTEKTSGLIYSWQAGALNEAFSDIWGETVDQINGYMDGSENSAVRTACASSDKWMLGEQTTAFGGAIRDMWNPNCKGDPGKVSDSQYWCSGDDDGGVHINSGIINHAYALLVDGGTYNGQSITGIGLLKAAHIFWRAQSMFMTRTTDFAAQADILEAAAEELIGTDLKGLSTADPIGLTGQSISASDVAELVKVILAVELKAENSCGFKPMLAAVDNICAGGSQGNALFFENFESGLGAWTTSYQAGSLTFTTRNWLAIANGPNDHPGHVAYGEDFSGGNCTSNFQNGVISLASPVINIPAGSSGPFMMAFDHYVSIEDGWDGGNIKYRINGGPWTIIPLLAFTENGYNRILTSPAAGSDNPLAAQQAFSGSDEGSVTGTWGQSRINLSTLGLAAGQSIEFRWDMGTDGCGGWDGWYIDDVRVYTCALPTVQFAANVSVANEAEAVTAESAPNDCIKYIEKTVQVKINKAPSLPVTVNLGTPIGTAREGVTSDFSISPMSFVLEAGHLSQNIVVRIYDDAYVEGDEDFTLSYSLTTSGDAYAETFNQSHTFTIKDNDETPGAEFVELVNEGFNFGLPGTWNVPGGGEYPNNWDVVQFSNGELDPEGRPLLFLSSYAAGDVPLDKTVESVAFNTTGFSELTLTYLEAFSVYNGGFAEQGLVEVWDGSAWQTILANTEAAGTSGTFSVPAQRELLIPIAYSNPAMKIRFHYIAEYDNYWGIDNVKIVGKIPTQIESVLTVTPDKQYLGPNETAYFYDPSSGNLLAKIKNLSSFDYGCTSVQIDRVGAGAVEWLGGYNITNKTFRVTPTNPNPDGTYEITLYYTESELGAFKGNVTSMGKSEGGIGAGNARSTSYAEVKVEAAFNTDFAYTATFDSGFSGFGLSDAPPIGSLPVKLSRFEGKHTVEGNELLWVTTEEVDNDYFQIERSTNAKSFAAIGKVQGQGNSSAAYNYHFTDTEFGKGISYYRLRQFDKDGKFAISGIVSIDNGLILSTRAFPNPVRNVVSLQVDERGDDLGELQIVNSSGKVVSRVKGVKIIDGVAVHDTNGLSSGVYQAILTTEKKKYQYKIVKQ